MQKSLIIPPRDYLRYFGSLPSGLFMLLAVLGLNIMGLVVLSSATQSFSADSYYLQKQIVWLCIAIIAGLGAAMVEWERLRGLVPLVAVGSVLVLLSVFIPGFGLEIKGARRWVDLGPMNLQVSEIAKIGMIFVLAHYLAENQKYIKTFLRGFLIPSIWIGLICGLIIIEPDFGTTALCGCVGYTILFLAGAKLIYMIPSVLSGIALFAVMVYHDPVRLARITSFLDVEGNKLDGAHQLWQGMLAFGVGGTNGVGLGNGRQQMSFLPESHTDFIFPIVGEELGVFFTVGIVLLFLAFFVIGVINLKKAPNLFQFSFIMGALLFVTLQSLINIGVVTGCLPTKGMSLPFISYGGSNLVLMFVFCGMMINAFRSWSQPPLPQAREI